MGAGSWFGVFAIESLPECDGAGVSAVAGACDASGIPCFPCRTRAKHCRRALRYAVSALLPEFASAEAVLPVLHINCHGAVDPQTEAGLGLSLADDDFVSWAELGEMLKQTVEDLDGQLLLSLSACKGADGARPVLESAGIVNILGASPLIYPKDLRLGFTFYYASLQYCGGDIGEAVKLMNQVTGPDEDGQPKFATVWDTAETRRNRLVRQSLDKYFGIIDSAAYRERLAGLFDLPYVDDLLVVRL